MPDHYTGHTPITTCHTHPSSGPGTCAGHTLKPHPGDLFRQPGPQYLHKSPFFRLSLILFSKCFLGNSCVVPQTLGQAEGSRHSRVSRQSQGLHTGDRQGAQLGATAAHPCGAGPRAPLVRASGGKASLPRTPGRPAGPRDKPQTLCWTLPWPQTFWIHT